MPFNILFGLADDQHRLLFNKPALQGIGNADLFGARFLAPATFALEQISSRLRPLQTLFAFLSLKTPARDFLARAAGGFCWNSPFVFSFAKRTVAISDTAKAYIQALIDRETLGLNNRVVVA